jgi:hypothetical protein
LFSVVPNSMVEERTVSNFTKINSADRANQKASTIVNITKVKQHIRRAPSTVRTSILLAIEVTLFIIILYYLFSVLNAPSFASVTWPNMLKTKNLLTLVIQKSKRIMRLRLPLVLQQLPRASRRVLALVSP